MRLATVAACALIGLAPLGARAEFFTGSALLARLDAGERVDRGTGQSGDEFDSALAMGFIAGVYDVFVQASFCSRTGVTLGQATAVTRMYVRALPHRHHEPAYKLVREALDRAFPCEGQRQQQRQGQGV